MDEFSYNAVEIFFANPSYESICRDCGCRHPTGEQCPRCGTDEDVLYIPGVGWEPFYLL